MSYAEEQLRWAEENELKRRIKIVENNLKPCPFCEGKAIVIHRESTWTDRILYWIQCYRCNTRSQGYDTPEDAGNMWNCRSKAEVDKCLSS